MSTKTIVECDVCGIQKKEGNHWWKIWITDGAFNASPATDDVPYFTVKDVCGKQHAVELFNRYLETGQLNKPKYNTGESEDE